eukprot:comp11704_c0_seq1/m.6268 comp11704_c0_seq1/g.6268  ORF comp11704_c0_seq1/g.6268 comp11704_c0_seq1/m.6268 type:complete len:174 (-) comp11704_c0_seq1:229-750(-)
MFLRLVLLFSCVLGAALASPRPSTYSEEERRAVWNKTARVSVFTDSNCTTLAKDDKGKRYEVEFKINEEPDECFKLPKTQTYFHPFVRRYGGPTVQLFTDANCTKVAEKGKLYYTGYGDCVGPFSRKKYYLRLVEKDCVDYTEWVYADTLKISDWSYCRDGKKKCDPKTWTCV